MSSVSDQRPWANNQSEAFIRINTISKYYGNIAAVDSVSLEIYQGELFCLLGGSGSGKSTLLRMMSGFVEPSEGQIIIDGQDMAGVPPHQRPVNMMFQSYALFPHMSVSKNIAYGLKRMGMSQAQSQQRVAELLEQVKLEAFADRMPDQLSGGQRQRVALARALARKPKLLLLDEPLGALDKKLREETQFELIKIQEESGVTFVVVTHDQEEAMTLATRIGVMNEGGIVQVGEPPEVYEYPNSRFVAEFVGSVNLFEAKVIDEGDDFTLLQTDDLPAPIKVGYGVQGAPMQKVSYAVRPEKITLSRERIDDDNCVQGVVDEVAYMGNQSVYRVHLGSGKLMTVTNPNRNRHNDTPIRWDEPVWLSWSSIAGVVLNR